jgi:hypothetical protein
VELDLTRFVVANAAARNAGAGRGRAAQLAIATGLVPSLDLPATAVLSRAVAASAAQGTGGRGVVPDLRRIQKKRNIEAKIRQAGLRPDVAEVPTSDPPERPVLLQCPAAGTRVGTGGTVRVVLAVQPEAAG